MKRTLNLFPVLLTVVMLFTLSCAETKETDDHANWKERNTEFINNIAANCGNADPESATEGQSFRLWVLLAMKWKLFLQFAEMRIAEQ